MSRLKLFSVGIAAVVALAATTARAADGPTFGVEGGVNLGSFSIGGSEADQIDVGRKVGVIAGAFAMFPVAPNVSIQAEAAYSQKNAKISDSQTGGNQFHQTEKFSVIDIPVLAHIDLQPMKSPSFYIVAGPVVSFLLTAKETDSTDFSGEHDIKDQTKSTDFGLIGGVGVMFGQVGVEARYAWGLVNLNNSPGDSTTFKSRTITILAKVSLSH